MLTARRSSTNNMSPDWIVRWHFNLNVSRLIIVAHLREFNFRQRRKGKHEWMITSLCEREMRDGWELEI